ncbi:hypothetical protein N431DRAFT_561734 [Stipitochalara longipes BDJ]|nr:hypothetical protein N431DRAFT_561734 [Stipitochalara longipes BDJ]
MQSPSPAPLPAPPASLFRHPSTNELQDHGAHQGSAAAWHQSRISKHPDETIKWVGLHEDHVTSLYSCDCHWHGVEHSSCVSTNDTSLADHPGLSSTSLHPVHSLSFAHQSEEHQGKASDHHSGSVTSDHGTLPAGTSLWHPSVQPEAFLPIENTHRSQFSVTEDAFEEKSLPQSHVNTALNVPGTVHNPSFGLLIPSAWSPQQGIANSAADQGFMGFPNPSMLPPQMPLQMMPPQSMLLPPQATAPQQPFPTLPLGTSLYPQFSVLQRTPCSLCPLTFTRQSDLDRHYTSVHLGIKHHCFYPGCSNNRGNGYCRLEKLRTHQREKHGFAWS